MNKKLAEYVNRFKQVEIPSDPFQDSEIAAIPSTARERLRILRQRMRDGRESIEDVDAAAKILLSFGLNDVAETWISALIRQSGDEHHALYRQFFGDLCIEAY